MTSILPLSLYQIWVYSSEVRPLAGAKSIFIYGPPATGKLTVATELAALTGYTLFHNHLTLNLAREIFSEFDDKLFDLVHEIRLDALTASAKYDRNLIFTNVYSGDDDDSDFVRRSVESVEQFGVSVRFVQNLVA